MPCGSPLANNPLQPATTTHPAAARWLLLHGMHGRLMPACGHVRFPRACAYQQPLAPSAGLLSRSDCAGLPTVHLGGCCGRAVVVVQNPGDIAPQRTSTRSAVSCRWGKCAVVNGSRSERRFGWLGDSSGPHMAHACMQVMGCRVMDSARGRKAVCRCCRHSHACMRPPMDPHTSSSDHRVVATAGALTGRCTERGREAGAGDGYKTASKWGLAVTGSWTRARGCACYVCCR